MAAFLISGLVTGASTGLLLGYSWAIVGLWTIALTRREFLVRAEQAEHTLAETRRAREAETQAAALAATCPTAERSMICPSSKATVVPAP